MRTAKTIVIGTVMTAIAGLTGLAMPSAAQADTGPCNAQYFCVFTKTSFQGTTCRNLKDGRTMGQCANHEESAWNRGDVCNGCDNIAVYWDTDFAGAWAPIPRGSAWSDLHDLTFTKLGGSGGSTGHTKPGDGLGEQTWHNIASSRWY